MLRYSELSKAQKAVIDGMKSGQVLSFHRHEAYFTLGAKRISSQTGYSLVLRCYVFPCYWDNNITSYEISKDGWR